MWATKIRSYNEGDRRVIQRLKMVYDGYAVVLWNDTHFLGGEAEEELELKRIGIELADRHKLALLRARVHAIWVVVALTGRQRRQF